MFASSVEKNTIGAVLDFMDLRYTHEPTFNTVPIQQVIKDTSALQHI